MRIHVGGNVPVYIFQNIPELRHWLSTGCPTRMPNTILQSFPGTYNISDVLTRTSRLTATDTDVYYRTYFTGQAHPLGFFYQAWAILEHDENGHPYNISYDPTL